MTLEIGAWAIPLAITIVLYIWALWPRKEWDSGMLGGLPYIFTLFAATTISLVSWLIWALVT